MYKKDIIGLLAQVKQKGPLVHHITNYVTVNDCANIVLALGGSPVMADDKNEVEEMAAIASSLVLNIGTLAAKTVDAMILAGRKANESDVPVILDPVGVGATRFRAKTALEIIREVKISVIRGNLSEIKVLSGLATTTKGVDSADPDLQGGREIAGNLARKLNCTVAITGARDVISDGKRMAFIENGHQMMARVTGTGCMATSLIGVYSGVASDPFLAAVAGLVTMGLAGEKAYRDLGAQDGVGTFRLRLFDHVYLLTANDIIEGAKLNGE